MGKISEATLRTTLKGTENIPITDTDLPKGRTTAADLKTFVTPDLSGYATNEDLDAKADVAGDEFTGPIGSPQVTITRPSEGAMAAILANSRDIEFRTMNAGVDSMTFNVQYATPLKITEAGILENNVLLENKYAKIEDIPSVDGFITKTDADGYYQAKGNYLTTVPAEYVTETELASKDYATQSSVNAKQDALVSGTNIKTINSQSLLGQGNIEITVEGGGITDAPSDGKMYGRKDAQWSEVAIPDTSDMLTKTEASSTYQTKGNYLTTETASTTYATKAEIPSLDNYYNKTEIDDKLEDITTGGDVDLSNYYNKTESDNRYVAKEEGKVLSSNDYTDEDKAATETIANKADKTELANKQDILVSGTNIKTVNGQTLLGNGNIAIDGQEIQVVNHGTNDTTFELTPNILHIWDEVASLILTLQTVEETSYNEFMIQFTSGATATTFSLPDTVKWVNTPTIEANKIYQISILNNLAVMGGWSNE